MKKQPLNSERKEVSPVKRQGWYKLLPNQATWQQWQTIAHRIGDFQARLLLTVLYALFIAPVGFCWQWVEDPLRLHRPSQADGYWQKRETEQRTLRQTERQG